MPQLAFAWTFTPSYAAQDFISSTSNTGAASFLEGWPASLPETALLSGPASSGKTHLARIWAARRQSSRIEPWALGSMPSAQLWNGRSAALLEDIDAVKDEQALFHLLRHAETQPATLLLTSRLAPARLPFILPDLRSRLAAMPNPTLLPPDDVLLHMFLAKSFADRQLRVSDDTLLYITRRVERSFAAIIALVEQTERAVFETGRELSTTLVKPLLLAPTGNSET